MFFFFPVKQVDSMPRENSRVTPNVRSPGEIFLFSSAKPALRLCLYD